MGDRTSDEVVGIHLDRIVVFQDRIEHILSERFCRSSRSGIFLEGRLQCPDLFFYSEEHRIAERTQKNESEFLSSWASHDGFDCYQSDEFLWAGVGEQHELPLTNHSLQRENIRRIGRRILWGHYGFRSPFSTYTETVNQKKRTMLDRHRQVIRCDQNIGQMKSAVSGLGTEGMHANTIPFTSQNANGLARKRKNSRETT